jgi:hypothetical protein
MAQPFDSASMRVSGTAVSLVDVVSQGENTGIGRFSLGGGVLAYADVSAEQSELLWFDRRVMTFALSQTGRVAASISTATVEE